MTQKASEKDLEAGRSALLGGGCRTRHADRRSESAGKPVERGRQGVHRLHLPGLDVNVGHCHPKVIAAVSEQVGPSPTSERASRPCPSCF